MGRPVDQPRPEGTRLGSYEIVRKLARGGMAELFVARTRGPEGFEKLVVLKKILPKHAENPKFVRLFLDEAKLVATLDHPHIAHVYDMGKADGNYFFTMEYVHGQDVRTTLRRTSRFEQLFPIDHAVHIARSIAAALHYAHERRRPDGSLLDIVHRDVSPSNILISYDGSVKLVDFGVAKAATSTVKTRTGTLKGKISYMSPEQAKGSPIDRRSDIFSLGIVLWEMVTTQRLFKGDNDLATIQMIINSKAQPPSQLNRDCSPELERIVLKALAINAEDRYQTAEQLQLDLEELAREQKLKQSSVALRAYMHQLFDAEISAWTHAQANGETLTDYLLQPSNELTTPVSESELDFISDDDDEVDDDDDADSEQATSIPSSGSMPTQQISVPPPPVRGETPHLRPVDQAQQMPLTIESAGPSIVVQDQTPPPMRLEARDNRTSDTPFPIAPPEWRHPEPTLTGVTDNTVRTKQVIIVGSIVFAVVVLLAALFGKEPPPAKVAPGPANGATSADEPTPVETTPTVNMHAVRVGSGGAGSDLADDSDDKAPSNTTATDPAQNTNAGTNTHPTNTTKPSTGMTKPSTATPATKPTTTSTTTTTKPTSTTTTTKPISTTTKPTSSTTTTTKPTTTKTTTTSKSTHKYDPDSPLPPP